MELILVIIAIYGIFTLISAFFSWLGKLNNKHKEGIRDKVLEDIQKEIDIMAEINKYKEKLKDISFERTSNTIESYIKKYDQKKNVKLIGEFENFLGECPLCKTGKLIGRKGIYGDFIGCSEYPECKYTENTKIAKIGYKKAISEQIIKEIQEAYT